MESSTLSDGKVVRLSILLLFLIGTKDRFVYQMTKGVVLTMTQRATDYVKKDTATASHLKRHTPFVDGYLKKNYPGKKRKI